MTRSQNLANQVASRAGARIETASRYGRGRRAGVASRAGARIETDTLATITTALIVASRAGARIETRGGAAVQLAQPGRVPRGRADRNFQAATARFASPPSVASRAGARIETLAHWIAPSPGGVASRAGARIETARTSRRPARAHSCRWLPEPAQIRRHVKLKAYHRPPRLARLVGGQLRAEWLRGTPAGAAAEGG